jgi:hypothetical protein
MPYCRLGQRRKQELYREEKNRLRATCNTTICEWSEGRTNVERSKSYEEQLGPGFEIWGCRISCLWLICLFTLTEFDHFYSVACRPDGQIYVADKKKLSKGTRGSYWWVFPRWKARTSFDIRLAAARLYWTVGPTEGAMRSERGRAFLFNNPRECKVWIEVESDVHS